MKWTMQDVTNAAQDASSAFDDLANAIQAYEDAVSAIRESHLPMISTLADAYKKRAEELRGLVEDSPDCFKKPKSQIVGSIKFGWRKQNGKVTWTEDDDVVLKRIKKAFPDDWRGLVIVKETPSKEALATLPIQKAKALGINVTEDGDVPFVSAAKSDPLRMAEALIKLGMG